MIMHLDMDAFFASVEQLDHPQYAGKPLIVGGGMRGVVVTASYEARVFGVHSAMPVAMAKKLCPQGIFIHGSHGRYSEISRKIMGALRSFSPIVQKASIDEAYLDATEAISRAGDPIKAAKAIKMAVAQASGGLTCSIGMAPAKFLAKICSDLDKPDGITILRPEEVDDFLVNLPVGKLPGVGSGMAASLLNFGIATVGQARALSREFLWARYGKFGQVLYDRARGIDPRNVHENLPAKSEGSERTFATNIRDRNTLNEILLKQARRISDSLQTRGQAGRTITLKIKFSDFTQITRSRTLEYRISSAKEIFQTAAAILRAIRLPQPARLIGISVSGFDPRPEQLPLPGLGELHRQQIMPREQKLRGEAI